MKELVLQYSVWGKKLDKPLHCTVEKVAKGSFYYWHVTSIEYPFIGVGDTQREAWESFEKTVIHDIERDEWTKDEAETPNIIHAKYASEFFCPFFAHALISANKCKGPCCMMWIYKGDIKNNLGRCGLVQWTQIFATTPCVSCEA